MTTQLGNSPSSVAISSWGNAPFSQVARWRMAALACGLSLAVVSWVFRSTLTATISVWTHSATYNHGFLIVPVALFFIWLRRRSLTALSPIPDTLGVLVLTLAGIAWAVGHATSTLLIEQLAFVTIIQGIVLATFGRQVFRALLFPLAFIYFAVPFGDELIPVLQDVTALMSVSLLRLVGIPVFVDGLSIATPTGNFLVAEACAGLRYLISTIAVGAAFANINYYTTWRRLLFFALSIIVPIVANGVRAFGIIALSYAIDNQTAVIADHITYGWVFYTITIVLLFLAGTAFAERVPPPARANHAVERRRASLGAPYRLLLLPAIGTAVVCAMQLYADAAIRLSSADEITVTAPPAPERWRANPPGDGRWQPEFANADKTVHDSYVDTDGATVDLNIGYYAFERDGAEAVTNLHKFGDDDHWRLIGTASADIDLAGQTVRATQLSLAGTQTKELVWYWYWIGGEMTGNPFYAKVLKAKALLVSRNPSAAVIAVSSTFVDRPSEAQARMRSLIESVDLNTMLAGAGKTTP